MSGAHLSCILLVVCEVSIIESAVLVSDESVGGDHGRIELDLNLYVLGDGNKGSTHLLDQGLAGLEQAVDVCIVTIALVGELLHPTTLVVAHAKTKDAEEDTRLSLFLNHRTNSASLLDLR